MKDNRDILNEVFFKKATYAEKQAKRLPQYSPIDARTSTMSSVPGSTNTPAFNVVDTDEVKKRLANTFGATFGNNNIKNLASRALKTFPIIVSDNLEPETVIMLKKLMEEQYAEYINLLVSNQVINLSNYSASDETGNIAIQALDTLSGTDFSKSRVANTAARTGSITADSVFQNVPLYNLLRENKKALSINDSIVDSLLENAVVIPSEKTKELLEFIDANINEINVLNEWDSSVTRDRDGAPRYKDNNKKYDQFNYSNDHRLRYYMMDDNYKPEDIETKATTIEKNLDIKRGFQGLDDNGKEIYTKLTTGDIVLNKDRFDQAINRSVGQILTDPANVEIRDKFEKATFLLQSRRIAGVEYYQYLTLRLGIPVSDAARRELVLKFKMSDIRKYGSMDLKNDKDIARATISPDEVKMIAQNRREVEKVAGKILNTPMSVALGIGAAGAGAGIGAILGGATLPALPALMISPIGIGIIAGAAVGGGAFLLARLLKKNKLKKVEEYNKTKIEGWERVERLINEMEQQQAALRKDITVDTLNLKSDEDYRDYIKRNQQVNNPTRDFNNIDLDKTNLDYKKAALQIVNTKKDYIDQYDQSKKMLANIMTESAKLNESTTYTETFNSMEKQIVEFNGKEFYNNLINICEEASKDKMLMAEILAEKSITSTVPMKVQYVEKKPGKDVMITPAFMARDAYAYGSTEIERRDNKDRRYNQPLIMTIKFKERFDDGRYSDNELTAVIGILGKIIRIPSEEMEYILRANNEGNTIEGIFKSGSDLRNTISDLMSTSRISKEMKALPQSADIWHNLEKVATLAAANTISGKRNNNLANAHIVYSQKEVDNVRIDTGVDYLKDTKKASALMKRYSAFTLMVANDAGQRVYIMDDPDNTSWEVVPYSALAGKDSGDQLNAALTKMMRL